MKKIFLLIMLISFFEGFSQITFDFQTPMLNLTPIKLSNSETKYLDQPLEWYFQNQFSLYNLDGSLYQTIQMPPKPDTSSIIEIVCYVTNSLFDNDPTNIEYLVHYDWCDSTLSGAPWRVEVIREDGTVLLNEAYASYNYLQLYNTEQGAKLMLTYYNGNSIPFQKKVFSLPGEFASTTDNEVVNQNNGLSISPNPNNGSFLININSKTGELGAIELYTMSGKLIGKFTSTGNMAQINSTGLPNGMYLLNAKTSNGCQRTKMIIQR
jgi:hypothetical protein